MLRVLVVDDDADIRYLAQVALDDMAVLEAADGPSALAILDRAEIDLVLLDVMMPSMDGFSVLEAIRRRSRHRDVPVVMLTAKAGEADHVAAFRIGADAYLTKPFDMDSLINMITEVTGRNPSQRNAARQTELGRAELLRQIEFGFRQ